MDKQTLPKVTRCMAFGCKKYEGCLRFVMKGLKPDGAVSLFISPSNGENCDYYIPTEPNNYSININI